MVNKFKQKIGSREQVMNGIAKMTSGCLRKKKIKKIKLNRVSILL